jgi:hypothetical protein
MRGLRRIASIGLLAMTGVACGVPSPEDARLRPPPSAARTIFARPYAEVYRACKVVIEAEQETPEWKELRLRVDDPEAGVLIAERTLEGIVPGIRVRDLWSFYVARIADDRTQVTYVIESSDQPKASVSARSWARGNGIIFPAMRQILDDTGTPSVATSPTPARVASASATAPPTQPTAAPPPAPVVATRGSRTEAASVRAPILDRAYAALHAANDWRETVRERTFAGEHVVLVGEWAQLTAHDERLRIAFPTYPAPPAYDVARLMGFLADEGFTVEVLPGSAFHSP